ncbi:MAG: hypothetical protein Q8O26_19960 [Phreatobacter sp.]|uniref:hypothetical protein n=1 Tax=Phreatobacter sp. TaxID=1966341 RepID=UPI002733F5F7|nr:hypothetical protein [Phreatobacter sp.]MDP2804153.1 hypothetical protein [Phreatobacter sp.]
MNRFKTLAIAALAVATMSVGVASQAEAGPFHRRHLAWGVGALATGLIVGGAIASSRAHASGYGYGGDCFMTRRWVETPYGMRRQTVRVCE